MFQAAVAYNTHDPNARAGVVILRKVRHRCNVNQHFEMPINITKTVVTRRPSDECVEGANAGRAAASAMIAMTTPPKGGIAKPSVPGKGWGSTQEQIKKATACGKSVGWGNCRNPLCSVCRRAASDVYAIDFMLGRM